MRTLVAIFADFQRGLLDGHCPLSEPLRGATLLEHTLRRAVKIDADGVVLVARASDRERAAAGIRGAGVSQRVALQLVDTLDRPRKDLIEAARLWNPTAWRGGILGMSWFDEFLEPAHALAVLHAQQAEALLCLSAAQPLLDARLNSQLITALRERVDQTTLVFTQAPPGLAGLAIRREGLELFVEQRMSIGTWLAYRPELPMVDPVGGHACLLVDSEVTHTAARFVGDTADSYAVVSAALERFTEERIDAEQLCRWHASQDFDADRTFPREIEIELTTNDPLPDTSLRPRGNHVPQRGPADRAALRRIFEQVAAHRDCRVVFGGFGDPLLHPQVGEILADARGANLPGIALVSPFVDVDDAIIDALFEQRVDLLQVRLDATTVENYARVHSRDAYAHVVDNLKRLHERRVHYRAPRPLLLPSLVRHSSTLAELEKFYDYWLKAAGGALLEGYSHYGALLARDELLALTPPSRVACRRLDRRVMLLADGRVSACDQDPSGQLALGNWHEMPMSEVWAGTARRDLRAAHAGLVERRAGLSALPVRCQRCEEWFRP